MFSLQNKPFSNKNNLKTCDLMTVTSIMVSREPGMTSGFYGNSSCPILFILYILFFVCFLFPLCLWCALVYYTQFVKTSSFVHTNWTCNDTCNNDNSWKQFLITYTVWCKLSFICKPFDITNTPYTYLRPNLGASCV